MPKLFSTLMSNAVVIPVFVFIFSAQQLPQHLSDPTGLTLCFVVLRITTSFDYYSFLFHSSFNFRACAVFMGYFSALVCVCLFTMFKHVKCLTYLQLYVALVSIFPCGIINYSIAYFYHLDIKRHRPEARNLRQINFSSLVFHQRLRMDGTKAAKTT